MPMENTYSVPYLYETLSAKAPGLSRPLAVSVPGSKSITNRALLLATLAQGTSTLRGVLFSDDSRHFLKCVQDLGFETAVDEGARTVTVKGAGGAVPLSEASQHVGSAGTAARFLTAFLGLSQGVYHMDSSEQMRRRPMAPLLDSLAELGCEVSYEGNGAEGRIPRSFPFTLRGHGFRKNSICVNIDESSQFLSALLIVSCLCSQDFTTAIEGAHGMAYIEMTRKMMRQFGVETLKQDERTFLTPAGQHYRALDYQIEPDVSAACYFYAMCPLLRIPVRVDDVHFDSLQGDARFLRTLEHAAGVDLLVNGEDVPTDIGTDGLPRRRHPPGHPAGAFRGRNLPRRHGRYVRLFGSGDYPGSHRPLCGQPYHHHRDRPYPFSGERPHRGHGCGADQDGHPL